MTRVACPSQKPSGLRGRPRPIRSRAAAVTALLVFFSTTPVADTFAIGRASRAAVKAALPRPRVERPTSEAFRTLSYDTRLHRRIPVGGEDDDDDLGEDWRALKRSVKNIAKKAGKKVKAAVKEGAKTVKEGGEKLVKIISPAEEEEAELVDESTPRRRPRPRSISTEGDTVEEVNGELDVLGRGGLTDLFFGVPDYFSPGGPLVTRLFGERDGGLLSSGSFAEQDRIVDDVLEEARAALEEDSNAGSLLGEPLRVGRPYSQESSVTTVNGKTKSTVVAKFGVRGPKGVGTASVSAVDGKVDSLSLEVDGWTHDVKIPRGWWRKKGSKVRKDKGNVIEAEVVEER